MTRPWPHYGRRRAEATVATDNPVLPLGREIPSSKTQVPSKSQPGKSKNPKTAATTFSSISQFGNLEFAWDLELGVWSFRRFAGAWDLGFLARVQAPFEGQVLCSSFAAANLVGL